MSRWKSLILTFFSWTPAALLVIYHILAVVQAAYGFKRAYLERIALWCVLMACISFWTVLCMHPRLRRSGRKDWWPILVMLLWIPLMVYVVYQLGAIPQALAGFENQSEIKRAAAWAVWATCIGLGLVSLVIFRWRPARADLWALVAFMLLLIGVILPYIKHFGSNQHYEDACMWQRVGDYKKALHEYRWLTERWWHRIGVWDPDPPFTALLMSVAEMAQQVGDFQLARRTYERIIAGERDYALRQGAEDRLGRLRHGLEVLDAYTRWLGGDKGALDRISDGVPTGDSDIDEVYTMYEVARIFDLDLGCKAKATEVYQKILDMDVPEHAKRPALEWFDKHAKLKP